MVFQEPSLGGNSGLSWVCRSGNNPFGFHSSLFEQGGGEENNRDQSPNSVMCTQTQGTSWACTCLWSAPDFSNWPICLLIGIMPPEWTKGGIYSWTSTCVALLSLLHLFALFEYTNTGVVIWSAVGAPLVPCSLVILLASYRKQWKVFLPAIKSLFMGKAGDVW